jgi:hypothetical protein
MVYSDWMKFGAWLSLYFVVCSIYRKGFSTFLQTYKLVWFVVCSLSAL